MMSSLITYLFTSFIFIFIFKSVDCDVCENNENNQLFPISIIHINDFHARFEETNMKSLTCRDGEKCIGGYARVVTTVKRLLDEHRDKNPIYMNAGDNYQGTIWFNTFSWNVTSYFLNLLPAEVMTLGNHEFDLGIAGLVPFLETIESPVVVANLDDSEEATMQGKYNKSIVIERSGRKIGVIGAVISTTEKRSNVDKLKFKDEVESIRSEARKMKDNGIDIIFALTHCGLDLDRKIAEEIEDIDVIVGGHSHTFLYSGANPPGPDVPKDTYPVVITHKQGKKALIVQASCYTKYVGDLRVNFDMSGNVVSWSGNPIFMDTSVIPDPNITQAILPWRIKLNALAGVFIGSSKVEFSKSNCRFDQCLLGCLVADAFYDAFEKSIPENIPLISVIQVGGLRSEIQAGNITHGDVILALPYGSRMNTIELRGDRVLETFEYSVSQSYLTKRFVGINMLQVSGARITFNISNPLERVVKIEVYNRRLQIFEPLDKSRNYKFILSSYLSSGGDGYDVFPNYGMNLTMSNELDVDIIENYIRKLSPISDYDITKNRRIIML